MGTCLRDVLTIPVDGAISVHEVVASLHWGISHVPLAVEYSVK